jgi:23S rRNA (guanosine2251-2'-O)-methyltransferase
VDYIASFHGILEALRAGPGQAKLLAAGGEGAKRGPRVREILETARKSGVPVDYVERSLLERIDPDNKGVVLAILGASKEASLSFEDFLDSSPKKAMVLVLDHIEDPQNFGAILRSADAFGAALVIAPTRRASPLGDAAQRTSAGAAAWVPTVFVQNLADALRRLKERGFWVYAADMEGESLPGFQLPELSCFVLGNEGSGVSRLLLDRADQSLSIPMSGHVDSLNVSVAAALFMYEYRRNNPA